MVRVRWIRKLLQNKKCIKQETAELTNFLSRLRFFLFGLTHSVEKIIIVTIQLGNSILRGLYIIYIKFYTHSPVDSSMRVKSVSV